MRGVTSITLVAWLLGGIAAPCLGSARCASEKQSACCCGSAEQCGCHVTAGTPVPSSNVAAVPAAPDLQGLPAADAATVAGVSAAPSRTNGLSLHHEPALPFTTYLGTCVIRC